MGISQGKQNLVRDPGRTCYWNGNSNPKRGDIPNTVTAFYLRNYDSKKALKIGDLPNSITYLNFKPSYVFQKPYKLPDVGTIPNSVTHLDMGIKFSGILERGIIPNSVIHLYLPIMFNA